MTNKPMTKEQLMPVLKLLAFFTVGWLLSLLAINLFLDSGFVDRYPWWVSLAVLNVGALAGAFALYRLFRVQANGQQVLMAMLITMLLTQVVYKLWPAP